MTQTFDPAALEPRDADRLLMRVIVPRPIGWASTIRNRK